MALYKGAIIKRAIIYIALTFGITWGIWIPAGLALGTFRIGLQMSTPMIVLVSLGMFVPLISALITHRITSPQERIVDALALRPNIADNIGSYLIAWFVPAVITLAGAAVYFLVFPHLFDPTGGYIRDMAASTGEAIDASLMPGIIAGTAFSALTIAPFLNVIPSFGEEAGWRGLLYPALRERYSRRTAIVASGAIWGLWHAPIIAMGHDYGMDYAGFPIAGIVTMIVACIAFGALLAWLRDRAESVWPCALAHGSFNAIASLGLFVSAAPASLFGPNPLGLVAGIPMIIMGLVFLVRAK